MDFLERKRDWERGISELGKGRWGLWVNLSGGWAKFSQGPNGLFTILWGLKPQLDTCRSAPSYVALKGYGVHSSISSVLFCGNGLEFFFSGRIKKSFIRKRGGNRRISRVIQWFSFPMFPSFYFHRKKLFDDVRFLIFTFDLHL